MSAPLGGPTSSHLLPCIQADADVYMRSERLGPRSLHLSKVNNWVPESGWLTCSTTENTSRRANAMSSSTS
jgi:hypothetical protein